MTRSGHPWRTGGRVVGLVTDAFGGQGGIAQYNRDVVAALARAGHSIELVSYGLAVPSEIEGVEVQTALGSRVRAAQLLARAMRRRPAMLWCGHVHLMPLAASLARLHGVPAWLHLHGIEAWDAPGALRRAACRRASHVSAVSRYTRRRALEWLDLPPERARVLGNTVEERFVPEGPTYPVESLGLRPGQPFLVTVGRLAASEAYKGHDRVIASLPALIDAFPDLAYVIVGDGDDRQRLESLAREARVRDRVVFAGHVARTELPALLRSARAFVMPSTGEGFGIAYLEAMACGVPVVALAAGGAVDPLQDGHLGTCAEPDALHAAIAQALDTSHSSELAEKVRRLFGRPAFERRVAMLAREVMEAA